MPDAFAERHVDRADSALVADAHAAPMGNPTSITWRAILPGRRIQHVAELEQARRRLFDATYTKMGGYREWPWHITWVRYGVERNSAALRRLGSMI